MYFTKSLCTVFLVGLLAIPSLGDEGARGKGLSSHSTLAVGNAAGASVAILQIRAGKDTKINTAASTKAKPRKAPKCGLKQPSHPRSLALVKRADLKVNVGEVRSAGANDGLYTYGLITCVGLAAVSGDRTRKVMAHVNAYDATTQQTYGQQTRAFLSRAQALHSVEITISVPDGGAGGPNLRATLEAIIRDIQREVVNVDPGAMTHVRPANPQGGGEMDISRSGVVYADGCQY